MELSLKRDRVMERAPPPSTAAAALAALDELLMDTPMSPKRPRHHARMTHPARWAREPSRHARGPLRTERRQPAASMQHTHHTTHSHTSHTTPARPHQPDRRSNREGPRAWTLLYSRDTALVLRHQARGTGPATAKTPPPWGNVASTHCKMHWPVCWVPSQGGKRT